MRRRRALVLIPLLIAGLAAPAWAAVDSADVQRAAEAVERARAEADALDVESRAALEREQSLRATLEELIGAVERMRVERSDVRRAARERVDELYMAAETRPGAGLILSGSFADAAVRLTYAEALADTDREVIADLAAAEAEARRLEAALEQAVSEQRRLSGSLGERAAAARAALEVAEAEYQRVRAEWEWQEAERRRRAAAAAATTTLSPSSATPVTNPPPQTTSAGPQATDPPATSVASPSSTEPPPSTAPPSSTEPPSTTAPAPPPVSGGPFPPRVERWRPLVGKYFSAGLVDEALEVIDCESFGNPNLTNPRSGAAGLFQHLPRYWPQRSAAAGFPGASPYDGEANIAAAAWLVNRSVNLGLGPWYFWTCKP